MASDADRESKTEEATEQRVREEKRKGNTPFSRELATAASLAGTLVAVGFFVAGAMSGMAALLQPLIEAPGDWRFESGADALALLGGLAVAVTVLLMAPLSVLVVVGIGASFLQGMPRLALSRIAFDRTRISPVAGLRRLLGAHGWTELARSVAKLSIVFVVAWLAAKGSVSDLLAALSMPPEQAPALLLRLTLRLLWVLSALVVILAVADLAWSRFSWRRRIRMTKQEIKEEHRNTEGDPIFKSRMRALARARSRRRMLAAVPRATLVVANPTHYAVALRYVRGDGGAPLVLAKGRDLVALKIRSIAEQHGIAVVEDKALARSLHDSVEVDQMIPPEFYKAIAEIIIFLNARRS